MSHVMVHYCSTGTIATKLAGAIYDSLKIHCRRDPKNSEVLQPRQLDSLDLSQLSSDDIVIVVASSTGRGDVPPNGQQTLKHLRGARLAEAHFVVFGNGDSSYSNTFNSAARILHELFKDAGLRPLGDGYVEGDNAKESPPWTLLDTWLKTLPQQMLNPYAGANGFHDDTGRRAGTEELERLISSYTRFRLGVCSHNRRSIKKVILHPGDKSYMAMDYLQLLVPNESRQVRQVLPLLGKKCQDRIANLDDISYFDFLQEFVDLEKPFRSVGWAENLSGPDLNIKTFAKLPVTEVLHILPPRWQDKANLDDILASMSLIEPRTFSIGSIADNSVSPRDERKLELLVQTKPGGRFSDRYLNSSGPGNYLRCRIQPAPRLRRLCDGGVPHIIAVATGSGFAPMQSLLRFRAQQVRQASERGDASSFEKQISLFVGFRRDDASLIREGIGDAIASNLFDMLFLMPSNDNKVRAQDRILEPGIRESLDTKIRNGAYVFVCANPAAADDVGINLSAILGCNARTALGDRYIQDSFGTS